MNTRWLLRESLTYVLWQRYVTPLPGGRRSSGEHGPVLDLSQNGFIPTFAYKFCWYLRKLLTEIAGNGCASLWANSDAASLALSLTPLSASRSELAGRSQSLLGTFTLFHHVLLPLGLGKSAKMLGESVVEKRAVHRRGAAGVRRLNKRVYIPTAIFTTAADEPTTSAQPVGEYIPSCLQIIQKCCVLPN